MTYSRTTIEGMTTTPVRRVPQRQIDLGAYVAAEIRAEDALPTTLRRVNLKIRPLSSGLYECRLASRSQHRPMWYRYGTADKSGSEWVFPGRWSGHTSPETVGAALGDLLGAGWSAHSLRHRFATLAYRAQRDLLTVQRLLGHSKPETTARYAEPPEDAAQAAVMAAAA